jgi:hypothetical protein
MDFRIVDFDMDDSSPFLAKALYFTCHPVVKSHAQKASSKSLVANGKVGIDSAVHAQPFHGLFVVFRDNSRSPLEWW